MRSLRTLLPALALVAAPACLSAQSEQTPEEFESKLGYRHGRIELKGGLATLEVPESFRFLDQEGARRVIEQAWGNPPGSAENVLGMLVPRTVSPLADEGWGVVITYEEDGWVNDDDAASIDYAKLLREMQDATREDNQKRREAGYDVVRLMGWAEPPTYNPSTHKLYWAKELAFGEGEEATHTLNYNVRVLGRRGVLVLNAVAGMDQLPAIRREMGTVLGFVEFNEGHRYSDYIPGTDRAAAYGVAGLIAGGVAVKAGFFKALLAGLLAAKKLLVVAGAAVVAFVRRLLGRREQAAG